MNTQIPASLICPRCGANLSSGACEYCGWNSPEPIPVKSLTLNGLLCNLDVTRDTCTFAPKVGAPSVVTNKEITQISLVPAPTVGTGELTLITLTGITQKITFLSTQNPVMGEIASYLLHVAPEAQFKRIEPSVNVEGISCPHCKGRETKTVGQSRKLSHFKAVFGVLLVITGVAGFFNNVIMGLIFIASGIVLAANGLRLVGKIKTECLCMKCRKRFWV